MRNPRPLDWPAQLDLFSRPTTRPSWEELPLDVRQTVTELLAKMLGDHRTPSNRESERKETGDE